ncbi:hypothetical protein JAAARDRAFT_33954 [Jaapia argillacea MUCL 33604]|uniref:Uncharacterized protein n=1 Tax=Jaapia argillacea MUCL 33604 TaxID=933084 RepID=A0A067PZB5_9AGAM|nr:hypothetical protein JAAARDRAFT_33954 [Jaapia argillacea MUCL 33604]
MGRTQTKSKRTRSSGTAKNPPSIPELFQKAQSLIDRCDYDLATLFLHRILEQSPSNPDAKEMLGVVLIETGQLDSAKETFLSLLPPNPDAPVPPPPSAHLYLAQLSDDDPHRALQHYQAAVDILSAQLKGKERAVDSTREDESSIKANIVRALVGMVEIWMDPSYDLCFDPEAEKNCEKLLELAHQTDPDNAEALQALASVRLSQERSDDAREIVGRAWTLWKDLDQDDPRYPPIPTRLSLVKLCLELSLYTPALQILQTVMLSDDQEVEAWYLEGWCFFLMSEQARETKSTLDDLTWEELGRSARDCLDTCQMLHLGQAHPDQPLLDHANELIQKLEAMGIQPSPEDDTVGVNPDVWEDVVDSDDGGSDVEMS